MQEMSRRNQHFTDSVIRRMTRISNECGAINLAQGFPDFDPPKALTDRLAEAKVELDPARIEQEIVLLAQKIDVAEELDRLEMHISETNKIMKKGGACGRRLDFMMQEFNRESNTLGSKSINAEVTQSAVELKVLIEQMREQIQNIE